MTSSRTRKPAPKRRRTTSKKKKTSRFSIGLSISRVLIFLALIVFFFISIGAAGYVIFFRVVVAAELAHGHTTPRVAIIIDDMGHERELGARLARLDLNLSFSFLPHSPHLEELKSLVRERGRTVLLHLPLEPIDPTKNPGPGAIYLDEHSGTIADLFKENLAQVPQADGVNNHMGSKFTRDQRAMSILAEQLLDHQLFFIDSYTTPDSIAMATVAEIGVPTARGHLFLDTVQQKQAVCDQLNELVKLAQRRQFAIGIGHPYEVTVEALQDCAPDILKSIELVGADELVEIQNGGGK
ncbi:MAG: divergent polysaccharide deacetylase family protein [Desulfocapsaceae bacterium]